MGVMIWGEANVLRLTFGRADFWDRRGGTAWTEKMNYREIRRLLEAKDEGAIRAIFSEGEKQPGVPRRPTVLPVGRLELKLPEELRLTTGRLHIGTGEIEITLSSAASEGEARATLRLDLSMHAPVFVLTLPDGLAAPAITVVTAYDHCGNDLADRGIPQPRRFDARELSGWISPRVKDGPLCVGYRLHDRDLLVSLEYGADDAAARQAAQGQIDRAITAGVGSLRENNRRWWAEYWRDVPTIKIPHERLSFLYHYGMYKLAGLTAPQGVAATLQGPWIEEYQIPPWSSDYHFNINVQMCYWPAYSGNRLSHLRPLFDLIWSWRDRMRDHARKFVGIDDGYVLPHAVSDECVVIGSFWTGTIDHACTGWVGKMMFDYYRMTGDVAFLRERAYPFMLGAMRVFEEMLEPTQVKGDVPFNLENKGDVTLYSLPVSVSPEYGGAAMWAWGRDASFQIGCIHMLIEALQHACQVLGETPRPIWREIQQGLPKACVQEAGGHKRIFLWRDQNLDESHRHHSHWAGVYPWDVIEPTDSHWREIVHHTYNHWMARGMGYWSGWCIPWAAMLHARVGCPDAAVAVMEYWQHLYTNEGHGTLHDPKLPKRNVTGSPLAPAMPPAGKRGEIMQMDAGMAACAAVMDFLVHTRRGVHHVLQGVPLGWRDIEVDGIRTEGGFRVGLTKRDGVLQEVRVTSDLGETFRLADPWGGEGIIERSTVQGKALKIRAQDNSANPRR
jgi:alpha-L-fucosidase 2